MPKLTNPSADAVRLVSGRTIAAGETVDVTDEEFKTAGPLFIRQVAAERDDAPTVQKRKTVRRDVETTSVEGVERR
jgi:hypothetical protein